MDAEGFNLIAVLVLIIKFLFNYVLIPAIGLVVLLPGLGMFLRFILTYLFFLPIAVATLLGYKGENPRFMKTDWFNWLTLNTDKHTGDGIFWDFPRDWILGIVLLGIFWWFNF